MRGDFTGFQFGNIHTEDLGIVRVSGGDRYTDQLHPEIKDITAEVPGMDGQYYFGSTYGTRTFDLELAFDSLTEGQFRQLRQVFGTRKIERLVFDEEPYKYYLAKLENPIELSYVCFDEPKKIRYSVLYPNEELPDGICIVDDGEGHRVKEKIDPWIFLEGTQRIYRGEGKITLICNYPFAKSKYKQLPEGTKSADWAISSGILSAEDYNSYEVDVVNNNTIQIYNPGDLPTDFKLYLPSTAVEQANEIKYINLVDGEEETIEETIAELKLFEMELADGDEGILIDTNSQLIIGVDSEGKLTSNLYNQYKESGYFFKLEPKADFNYKITLTNGTDAIITYQYLYF